MMMITSKAGERLARARASELAAFDLWSRYPTQDRWEAWKKKEGEARDAGIAVAEELIAAGFHDLDGES